MGYFCDNCSQAICLDCINIGKHSQHRERVVSINERATEFSESVDLLTEELKNARQNLVSKKKFEHLKQQEVELLASLDSNFETFIQQTGVSKKEVLQRIQSGKFHAFEECNVAPLREALSSIKDNFSNIANSLEKSIDSLETLTSAKKSVMLKSSASPSLLTQSTVLEGCIAEFETLFPNFDALKPTLLFRASVDGYTASQFHAKCDGKSNVLVLFKTANGNVAGGYSPTAFDSSGSYLRSDGAFLFRVKSSSNANAQKFHIISPGNDIFCNPSYGPVFGGGNDLLLSNNCNQSNSSCSAGNSYEGNYSQLLGESSFLVQDYEVYQLTPRVVQTSDFLGSSILSSSVPDVSKLGLKVTGRPELLFKASNDGFAASTFHSKCDNKSSVFVVFNTTNGNIAGGYSSVAFNSSGSYLQSPGSFLFRIKNSSYNEVAKYDLLNTETNHIYCNRSYGPTFGSGHDLYLACSCNASASSTCNAGSCYAGSYTEMIGENTFTVADYEVWSLL
ncbi:hypothetical protein RCL1_000844 [Eukaryota sp. TZLM3-RCL]